jgi:uncharacterized damage-inducible protein DinB
MADDLKTLLEVPAGFRSEIVARYLWQLDDLTRRVIEATSDLTPEELGRQMAPGVNTLGMLLAHLAVAETHIGAIGLERRDTSDVPGVIGIRMEDDGLPLPPDGRPPEALQDRDIAFFHALLDKARVHTRQVASTLTDADLPRVITRPRPDGSRRLLNVEWALYHLVEHQAGHLGQILLLRHLVRTAAASA